MRVVEFLNKIMTSFSVMIQFEIQDQKIFKLLIDFVEEFPYNNLLHLRIHSILMLALDAKDGDSRVIENILDDSGLANLVLRTANKEGLTMQFPATGNHVGFGFTIFVQRWATQLKLLLEDKNSAVVDSIESIPEITRFLYNELQMFKDIESNPLVEDPRKPKSFAIDDDGGFGIFSKLRENDKTVGQPRWHPKLTLVFFR